jgi:sugar lactone lactonase YvrE
MKQPLPAKIFLACMSFLSALLLTPGCSKKTDDAPPPKLIVTTFATGFTSPNGIATDSAGNIWVSDQGTGANDGKIWVIKPGGDKFPAIINFESVIVGADFDAPSHLLFADGLLYILGAKGKMYKADVSSFKPGNPPLTASSLGVEDIGTFVLSYPFVKNTHQSHPYGITRAPDGSFYITDAAANAVLRRSRTGIYSVVAEVPGVQNPLPLGPPMVESVPTGVIVDHGKLLVSTLLGFPFPPGKAVIYQISTSGELSVFQQGFTSLVDIVAGNDNGHLVAEHGTFGSMGFTKNTGRLVWANGQAATPLVADLNLPVGIAQSNDHTWYVTSLGDKSVLKVAFE